MINKENNWIKLDGEKDLPKEDGLYWTVNKNNEVELNTFGTLRKNKFTFNDGRIIYFQRLDKPIPPSP